MQKYWVRMLYELQYEAHYNVPWLTGTGWLQLKSPGFGTHSPPAVHTAANSSSGTRPVSHWKIATDPSILLVEFTEASVGDGGSLLQIAVIKMGIRIFRKNCMYVWQGIHTVVIVQNIAEIKCFDTCTM